ncbi:MAG TPA: LuxR C-terminal-related transcriptional regulator [Solirubrobacteraceae bacterium]
MSLAVKSGHPLPREGLVRRPRLLAKLTDEGDAPLLVIVAPAGYGKTSILTDFTAAERRRPSAWLALEQWHDDDPILLIRDIAACLADLGCVPGILHDAFDATHSARELTAMLPLLAATLEQLPHPILLVLDDVHNVRSAPALAVLTTVAEHLPLGSQLALASRTRPALPLGRLRAHRSLVELDVLDLAMTSAEAASLMETSGVPVEPADLLMLLRSTEGWPAGLYLAALSVRDQPDADAALRCFSGRDHLVADYLREEFLSELHAEDVEFLIATSVSEYLCAPLCDALLDTTGSARTLDGLSRGPLPLTPVDRTHDRYRLHPLLREMLLGELRHSHPELEERAHLRASVFHARQGDFDSAISHAVAAGDATRAGELLWEHLPSYVTVGRNDLLRGWLRRFSTNQISANPPLALTAAHSALALGDLRQAEHWGLMGAAALARSTAPPRVASLPAGVAVIEAAVSRSGLGSMGRDAARAFELEREDSPWRPIFSLLQGVADHLTGHRLQAREHLENGIHRSSIAAPTIETLCLSQLAMITVEEGDWERSVDLVARAVSQIEFYNLSSYPSSALAYAVSAEVRSHVGQVDEGKRHARRASHLLGELRDFIPWYEAETRITLARAAVRLADVRSARTLLAEASQLARRVPDAVLFAGWLDEAWGLVDTAATTALAGPATLTMAELRILRFLPTHLSFREIGERLHVSTNTVKTQAHAIYRKLDVRSRSDAVTRASDIGLLER